MADDVATRIEETLTGVLGEGIDHGVFPGASASVALFRGRDWTYVDAATGSLGEGLGSVDTESVYDLASITKPFVATSALTLHQRGAFDLGARVADSLDEAMGFPIGERTWEELLTHRSGLEAWVPFYETLPHPAGTPGARAWIVEQLLRHWEQTSVGTPVYSDLGYILVGLALERVTGMPLADVVQKEVTGGLDIERDAFFGAASQDEVWKTQCAATGWSEWRGEMLCGEVHDDNCAALGGVAGHAGMFGRARAVARFGAAQVSAWHGRHGALAEERILHAVSPRPGGSHRLGWDGRADEGSAAGSLIDPEAFGHLGFTGTSLWCDPQRQLVVVVLTNRVAVPGDNAAIRRFRPRVHDALMKAFDGF
ncbi:MAG: serine hydrolase domain-containing protein [Myxococcota bacterium]